jgi:hypothetical protein
VVENVSVSFAGQVEVAVIGQIKDSVLIGSGGVLDLERMLYQGVADLCRERAGKALIAIFAYQGELDSIWNRTPVPDQLVEAFDSAMQGVSAVVGRQMVLLAVEGKTRVGDPVA